MRRYLVAVAVLFLVAACGVPDSGPAVPLAKPSPARVAPDTDRYTPANPRDLSRVQDLVEGYLHAATGSQEYMRGQIGGYLTETARQAMLSPGAAQQQVLVVDGKVDAAGVPDGKAGTATFTGRILGALVNGWIDTSRAKDDYRYAFNVVSSGEGDGATHLAIANPPPDYLLDLAGLDAGYLLRPVYFQSGTQQPTLVPDLRYVSRAIVGATRHQLLVNLLLAGPSPALQDLVSSAVPPGTDQRSIPVPAGNGDTVVDLSAKADVSEASFFNLAVQVAWTLQADTRGGTQLWVDGRAKTINGAAGLPRRSPDADALNLAVRTTPPRLYAIRDGKAIDVLTSKPAPQPALYDPTAPTPLLLSATAYADRAALVTVGNGLRIAVAQPGRTPSKPGPTLLLEPKLNGAALVPTSRPEWLGNASRNLARLLVGANQQLYVMSAEGSEIRPVEQVPGAGDVTSVSAAPDGRRIAFVRGGVAYAGVLTDTTLRAWPIRTGLDRAVGVAWTQELRFAIFGPLGASPTIVESGFNGLPAPMRFSSLEHLRSFAAFVPSPAVSDPKDPNNGVSELPVIEEEGNKLTKLTDAISQTLPGGSAPFYVD